MSTIIANPSAQIKITLPEKLQELVQSRADQYGLSISTYIKHLVLVDVKDIDMPVFKMSEKTEKVLDQALEDYSQGKTHQIKHDEVDEFLNDL
ncbi:MAG: hypothetical protein ABI758_00620 [Candidatus Woesebacteria bacterium]